VTVPVGDAFEVVLEGARTAGYVWEVSVGELRDTVRLTGRETRPAPGPALGRPTTQVFRFLAVAPGSGTLAFRYGRGWESAPLHEHLVRVSVV
jgi:predicted secreted protein